LEAFAQGVKEKLTALLIQSAMICRRRYEVAEAPLAPIDARGSAGRRSMRAVAINGHLHA
jgi:hypothetical protein